MAVLDISQVVKNVDVNPAPVRQDDAVRVGVEDVDDAVGLDERLDLVQDERPFQLKKVPSHREQDPNLGIFWSSWEWNILVCFMTFWNIL
jgi:hypothetical protein